MGANPEAYKVLPVNFATEHKNMLSHLHMLINKEYLAIPQAYEKLIISLRTAYAREYSLDKELTSYSDSIDALRLACKMYKMNWIELELGHEFMDYCTSCAAVADI